MFAPEVQENIRTLAEKNNLDPNALLAIVEVESAGRAWWVIDGKNGRDTGKDIFVDWGGNGLASDNKRYMVAIQLRYITSHLSYIKIFV